MRTLYGYRYKPGGMVLEMPGRDLDTAAAEVVTRRQQQRMNNNPATVELVERGDAGWQSVPLPGDEPEAVQ